MFNFILKALTNWLIPFVCGLIISMFVSSKLKYKSLKEGLKCLLRAEIIRSYDKYTERGRIPIYAKEALSKEYKAYHSLGGNDVATDLYTQLSKLSTY